MTPSTGPSRRQYSSCDACRRSKRRCCLSVPPDGETNAICTNCKRLGYPCTFNFARSRVAPRRSGRRYQLRAHLSEDCDGPNANALDNAVEAFHINQLQESSIPSEDVLPSWLDFDLDNCFDDATTPFLDDTDLPDILAATCPATATAEPHTNALTSLLPYKSDTMQYNNAYSIIGSSPRSPLYLLNSKINATLLDECLARIYDTIVTGCASRFIDYDCNLSATRCRYRLEDNDIGSPREQRLAKLSPTSKGSSPKTSNSTSQSGISCLTLDYSSRQSEPTVHYISHEMTIIGTVRFLDHFSDLYGNRLDGVAQRQSDAVLKAVLRAFSLQWLSPTGHASEVQLTTNGNSIGGRETTSDSLVNAFYDSWFHARALIRDSLHVPSFRVVSAILMFDGISLPARYCGDTLVAHEFLNAGLEKLHHLDGLVKRYCANLGPLSTYGAIAEASLSVVGWCGHVRDIGAALTTEHRCRLPIIPNHEKEQASPSIYEPMLSWPDHQSFSQDLDDIVPGICRVAVAEAFRAWREIVEVKSSLLGAAKGAATTLPDISKLIASTIATISRFDKRFRPFLDSCMANFRHLSIRSRLSSVSIMMFWDLGVLVLAEALKASVTGLDHSFSQGITSRIQAYREESASSVARTMECVLSLPPEETFNLRSGVNAEASIITYHITPSLMAAALQKAIESMIDLRFSPPCAPEDRSTIFDVNEDWIRQVDLIMKGLVSLDVTIGGSQVASVAIQDLMRKYGDIISECWSCGFET